MYVPQPAVYSDRRNGSGVSPVFMLLAGSILTTLQTDTLDMIEENARCEQGFTVRTGLGINPPSPPSAIPS